MENQAMVALKDDQNKGSDLNGKLPIHALSNQITTQDGATIEFDKKLTKEQYIAILKKIDQTYQKGFLYGILKLISTYQKTFLQKKWQEKQHVKRLSKNDSA